MDQSQISISRIEEFSKKTLISATKFFRFFFFSPKYIFYQSYIGIKMDWRWCTLGFSNNGKCKKFLNGKPGFNAKDVVAKMNWYYNFLFTFFLHITISEIKWFILDENDLENVLKMYIFLKSGFFPFGVTLLSIFKE